MRYVFVCPDEFLWELMASARPGNTRPVYVVERPGAGARIARHGGRAVAGELDAEAVYRKALRPTPGAVVVAVEPRRRRRVVAAIRRVAPEAPIVVLSDGHAAPPAPGVVTVPMAAISERLIAGQVERALTQARVERVRAHFRGAARVLIMMQDDPDPDAIASALALRALLGRTRAAAPIATFGAIARPENRAMTRILGIEVERIEAPALGRYDTIALVDAQPGFFEERFPRLDLVIDHHPRERPVEAAIKDIRPGYGATSTILTEYLQAAGAPLGPRLATALLYGIKADTLQLERNATRADMEAFAFLHPRANHNALRRIERPELPEAALDTLARGIARHRLVRGVVFAHLGRVAYPELIAQFADLFLQVQGAEWSVVSGVVDGELHVSVRNVGYVRAAGEVARVAFGPLGKAGGHRAMAKAVVRLEDWRARVGETSEAALQDALAARFLAALEARPLQ